VLEGGQPELPFQLTSAPTFLHGQTQIELALVWTLGLGQDDQVVRPGQLCHQRCHFLVAGIRSIGFSAASAASNTRSPSAAPLS
jgi:hypothetical protein